MNFPADKVDSFRRALKGRTVCVTGGAGFIGGHLASTLLELGAEVQIIDDLSNADAGLPASLVDRHPGRCRFVFGSILDPRALSEAVMGAEIVFHLAAMGSVPRSIAEPERSMAVNLTGTLRVAQACREAGVRRWVYSASSSAYGDDPSGGATGGRGPCVETMSPRPMSPYAVSKLGGEYIIRTWAVCYALPGMSLRYFNIFGPRQPSDSPYSAVIARFIRKLSEGQRPVVYGDGLQTRDFTPVDNAVYANLLAATGTREPRGEVVNIGLGRRTTVLELISHLSRLTGRGDATPAFEPERTGDIPHSQADITRARELLGYEPVRTFEEGLQATVDWFTRAPSQVESTNTGARAARV
ncbi:MAG: NAD-dependent epimerase/dehydratase family protein [Phycisphaerales bacterium]